VLESVGATVLANACGPCIGQWRREEIRKGEKNSIITSFNRNFPGRNDANPETLAFIASPEIVMACGLAGRLSFDPATDSLETDGKRWQLAPPPPAPDIPRDGFVFAREGYLPPAEDRGAVQVVIAEGSERLQRLAPFAPPEPERFQNMPLLLKTKGKTTTDHISPAGPWLRYRGHLDRISDNMFSGAVNAFTGHRGTTRNPEDGEADRPVPQVARTLGRSGRKWVVVGDENYGEGSSREHAAMSPRLLGAGVIVARSFARIHETNLKKQGVLPLTFVDPADYEKVRETDRVSVLDLQALAPKQDLTLVLHHEDGSADHLAVRHTLNAEQIEWFRAGSALNHLRRQESRG
jgi:aconitate hydratase